MLHWFRTTLLETPAMAMTLGIGLFTSTSSDAHGLPPHGMVRIPSMTIELGLTLDGIVNATTQCSTQSTASLCRPEQFSSELSDETKIHVSSFFLHRHEVTQAQYQRCVLAGRCRAPAYHLSAPSLLHPTYPVVLISQGDANAYCRYIGARLPTEAEFEAAAGGPRKRIYPWGDLFHSRRANFGSRTLPYTDRRDDYDLLAPAHTFQAGASPQGVMNLAGNAAEWTSSPFVAHGGHGQGGSNNPVKYVIKGGSYASSPLDLRTTARQAEFPTKRLFDVGFRCAKSLTTPS